jgi:hypothetical protein
MDGFHEAPLEPINQIPDFIKKTRDAILRLNEEVARIEKRIEPVLSEPPPEKTIGMDSKAVSPGCQLSMEIHSLMTEIDHARLRVAIIADRVML